MRGGYKSRASLGCDIRVIVTVTRLWSILENMCNCANYSMHPICCVYTGSHVLGLILFVVHNRSGLQE